ncbi:monofunctional biosynthetic peptidoglycan transglycosylase [Maritimibacter sp. UBA3975]|uniref:monofunctional biosynthetic peptidoglycan transglycosylase n=1 Tax=Maritimibacter sp. UBA3975 TaxID=1946833 RepID=UPI000C0A3587|nr:monofunctional biosynthetic peptidoglycan transglycosylase [Maritimibacter sp. UBA3975]MAM63256.1 monofunctional biosynthetic peptidoglycan transglycosylase [Maritimibacter sp.]|tara:strand:+ start:17025 stop:17753 length:729 start_codon:yes stop_codon:yes gene_type:complete
MARTPAKSKKTPRRVAPKRGARRFVWRWARRGVLGAVAFVCLGVSLYAFVNPPTTLYMASESRRLGGLSHDWAQMEDIAPVMARSVVAAEDANFCLHWGFDMAAIRQVIEAGETRGASTLSQQVVKNVYLWPARSYVRKALEAVITPAMELVWTKRRIVEVYLNVAEFDEGVFGVHAAAAHYYGVTPDALTAMQAARLAAILPDPKGRSASRPGQFVQRRAASIADGAATILRDGRADCLED